MRRLNEGGFQMTLNCLVNCMPVGCFTTDISHDTESHEKATSPSQYYRTVACLQHLPRCLDDDFGIRRSILAWVMVYKQRLNHAHAHINIL